MSYVSVLKNIPEILTQPTGIAAIASLGLHGAIALIVPLIPSKPSQPEDTTSSKAVGLLELSPADQRRLPQTSDTSKVSLQPQLSLQQQFPSTAASIQGMPPAQPPLPGLVMPPASSTSLANIPPSLVPKDYTTRTRISLGNLRNSGEFTSPVALANNIDPRLPEPSPVTVNSLPRQLLLRPSSNRSVMPSLKPINTTPYTTAEVDNLPKTRQSESPTPAVTQIAKVPEGRDRLALAKQPIPMGSFTPIPIGALNSAPELPNSNTPESSSKTTPTEQQTRTNEGYTAKIPESTTPGGQELALASFSDLYKKVQQQYPQIEWQKTIIAKIATQKQETEGVARGIIVVNADGEILNFQLLDKTTSPQLQLEAREYFKNSPPQGKKQIRLYPFYLSFKPIDTSVPPVTTRELTPKSSVPTPQATPTQTASTSKPLIANQNGDPKLIQELRQLREQKQ